MHITRIPFLILLCLGINLHAQITLPGRMWADTAHAPFIYGVASGDPTTNSVIIWSAVSPDSVTPQLVDWEIALDSTFANILQTGAITADSGNGFTAKVDVQSLSPATHYYYRFALGGAYSVKGHTKTAPAGQVPNLRFGVGSCSSIFSGYFGAYRHLSQRNDLDLFIHLGDYIYNSTDADELVRIPVPAPVDPKTLPEYRDRQRYYLLDPDLRAARQNIPFAVIWDNHDVSDDTIGRLEAGTQAFWEFVPSRQPDLQDRTRVYRTLHYGDLVDIFLLDGDQFQGVDTLPSGDPSYLGEVQNSWLEAEIAASTAQWHLVGGQKMFSQWSTAGIPGLPIGNGQVADPGSWDGFPASRTRLLNYISGLGMDNFIYLSGDLHLSMATDVCVDPFNGPYDPNTGIGAQGVEFLASSITRGNFDEYGIPGFLIPGIKLASDAINEHHVYIDLTEHGYGILDVKPDSAIAEFWYVDVMNPNSGQNLAQTLVVGNHQNHWARGPLVSVSQMGDNGVKFTVFPSPAQDRVILSSDGEVPIGAQVTLWQIGSGKKVAQKEWPQHGRQLEWNLQPFAAGTYMVQIQAEGKVWQVKFVKE